MNTLLRSHLAILSLGLCGAAAAADIEPQGARLRVQGPLDGSGLAAFTEQLTNSQIRTVVFEDSRGGSAEVAEQYARAIRDADVNTEVRGQCSAACAYAFLAGKEHRFGRGPQVNSLLVPLNARPEASDLAQLNSRAQAPMPIAVPATTNGMSSGATRATSLEVSAVAPVAHELLPGVLKESWRPEQGVLFVSTPTLFGRVYTSFYCDGTQGRDLSKCENLNNADPYSLGVLTSR